MAEAEVVETPVETPPPRRRRAKAEDPVEPPPPPEPPRRTRPERDRDPRRSSGAKGAALFAEASRGGERAGGPPEAEAEGSAAEVGHPAAEAGARHPAAACR